MFKEAPCLVAASGNSPHTTSWWVGGYYVIICALEGYSVVKSSEAVECVPARVNPEATKLSRSHLQKPHTMELHYMKCWKQAIQRELRLTAAKTQGNGNGKGSLLGTELPFRAVNAFWCWMVTTVSQLWLCQTHSSVDFKRANYMACDLRL